MVIATLILNKTAENTRQIPSFDMATSIQGAFLIIVSSLGMVFFPDLSRILNDKTLGVVIFWEKIGKYLKIAMILGITISILATILSPIAMILIELLGKGQNNGVYIIQLVQVSSFRLFFQAIKEILDKYLYAKEKQWEPMFLSIAGIIGMVIFYKVGSLFGPDAGILATLVLTSYYLVWCVFAILIVRNDYKKSLIIKNL